MQAGVNACVCPDCDSVCEGQFKGCADVWARGPRPVEIKSSTLANGHVAGNGQLDSALNRSAQPVSPGGALSGGVTSARSGTDARSKVVAWPEASTHVLRTELEALSRIVTDQQGVVTQLVAAYSDLRRDPGHEALLLLVRKVVEDALGRHEALLREEMARDSRRLNDVAGDVNELRREYRADQSMANSGREQLRAELHNALGRQKAEISELLTANTNRLDQALVDIRRLTTEQQAHSAGVTAAHEALRIELDDALRQERVRACEAMATNADLVNEAIKEARQVVTSITTATMSELRDENTHTRALLSDLEQSLTHVQDSTRNDREATRQLVSETLDAFAGSMGDAVTEKVGQAVEQSEARATMRLENAIGELRQSLNDTEEASERQLMQAAEAERERLGELQTCLVELREALEGTHALAAAQQVETELLDGAMSTLQQSLVDLRTSVATQHLEIREDLARQRRSSSALLKRQLRPIVESLPVLVAAAVEAREEETALRIERAVAKLRRSLQQTQR